MAKLTEKEQQKQAFIPFEQTYNLRGLRLFVVVVHYGQAEAIRQIFNSYDTALTLVTSGVGRTFKQNAMHNTTMSKKHFIFAIVRDDKAPLITERLTERFKISKAATGIAYSIDLTSVVGVSVYKFLTNTRKVTKVSKHGKAK